MAYEIGNCSNEAKKLLNELGISTFPIDVESIAETKGISVIYEDMDDDVSGFLALNKFKNPKIVVNLNHSKNRQRFTIAHEIGHWVLHAKNSDKDIFVDKRYHRANNAGDWQEEKEANSFAAELLMPKDLLIDEVENSETDIVDDTFVYMVSKKLGVSEQALGYRLGNLDIEFF